MAKGRIARRLTLYEHRSEPLLSAGEFLRRMLAHGGLAFVLAVFALALGMVGYRLTESLGWIDAFLNAAMILAGMGEVAPLTTSAGKLFAGAYALFSAAVMLATTGVLLAPLAHRLLHRLHLEEGAES